MGDAQTTIGELKAQVAEFAAARHWQPFHAPKNLAMALAVEAAELMEPFLWLEPDASRALADDPERREHLADEMADVFILLLNLSHVMGLDLSEAFRSKIAKNAIKYPAPSGA